MIGSQRILASETVTILWHAVDASLDAIPDASDFQIGIYRFSDDSWLDFNDHTFGGTITTRFVAVSQIDATNAPGVYKYEYDLSQVTNHATTSDTWLVVSKETSGTDLGYEPIGEILVNPPDQIAAAYGGYIWIDNANGTSGSTYGIHGTMLNPCTTAAEADTLSSSTGIKAWKIIDGTVTLNATSYENYTFEGTAFQAVVLNEKNIIRSHFHNCTVIGTCGASSTAWTASECLVGAGGAYVNPSYWFRVWVSGTVEFTFGSGSPLIMHQCCDSDDATGNAKLDLNGGNATVTLQDWQGKLTIAGTTHSSAQVAVFSSAADVTLDSTNTDGSIRLGGNFELTDNSNGSTVDRTALVRPFEQRIVHALQCGNYTLDNLTLDGNGFPTSQRLRVWDSAANVPSSGGGSETTGLLATITLTGTADTSYPTLASFIRGTLVEA